MIGSTVTLSMPYNPSFAIDRLASQASAKKQAAQVWSSKWQEMKNAYQQVQAMGRGRGVGVGVGVGLKN